MNRRTFLLQSSVGLGGWPVTVHAQDIRGNRVRQDNATVGRVKLAMLSMQRASWEQGVAMQALLELGDDDMVYLMAKEACLRQQKDGRLSVVYTDSGVTDPAASGEGVLFAAQRFEDAELKAGAQRMLDYLLTRAPKSAAGVIYHTLKGPQFWIDSMYMGPPFLAVAGHPAEAVKQIRGYRAALWNGQMRLYSHMWDDEKKAFINPAFWGVGNGWAAAGVTRVIQSLPATMGDERQELIGYVREHLQGCLAHIRQDGLFHNVIDQPETFVETNLSQMLAYTIFRGVKGQWLDRALLPPALQMREAARAKVDRHGYVQGVAGAPSFQRPGRATEGQAFFLLMEAAYRDTLQAS